MEGGGGGMDGLTRLMPQVPWGRSLRMWRFSGLF